MMVVVVVVAGVITGEGEVKGWGTSHTYYCAVDCVSEASARNHVNMFYTQHQTLSDTDTFALALFIGQTPKLERVMSTCTLYVEKKIKIEFKILKKEFPQ